MNLLQQRFARTKKGSNHHEAMRLKVAKQYRSGKPATVWGKDIKNPQPQAAPYNFEYLDVESKERINDIIVNSGLPVITSDE